MEFRGLLFCLSLLLLPLLQFVKCDQTEAMIVTATIHPPKDEESVNLDSDTVFTCDVTATGNNPVKGEWFFKGKNIKKTSGRVHVQDLNNKKILRIKHINFDDEGEYECVATSEGRDASDVTIASDVIRLLVYKSLSVLSEETQYSGAGAYGEVECLVEATHGALVTWRFENRTLIPNNTKYDTLKNRLIIKELNKDDAQKYICDILISETGEAREFVINFVVVQTKVKILSLTIEPKQPVVGEEVRIICKAEGTPEPTYIFKKGDVLIDEQLVEDGILTINPLKLTDEGAYVCTAGNVVNSEEASIEVQPTVPVQITFISQSSEVAAGDTLDIVCRAKGVPEPRVSWQKDGPQDQSGATQSVDISTDDDGVAIVSGTMTFNPVSEQDADTSYTCTAYNPWTEDKQSYKMNVLYKPVFDQTLNQLEVFGWRTHQSVLKCQAKANPIAEIEWFSADIYSHVGSNGHGDAVVIESEPPYELTNTVEDLGDYLSARSLLVDVEDDPSVYRKYICKASNSQGSTWHSVVLKEAKPPGEPKVKVDLLLSTYIGLLVEPPEQDNGQPVTKYSVEHHALGDQKKVKHLVNVTDGRTVIELRSLKKLTKYVVSVRAVNAVGVGRKTTVQKRTLRVSPPVPINITSERVSNFTTHYSLEWETPDDGGSPISSFTIIYRRCLVNGTKPASWKIFKFDDEINWREEQIEKLTKFDLINLQRNSFYQVNITARNKYGESQQRSLIFKTNSCGYLLTANLAILLIALLYSCDQVFPW